jgi:predicted DNA binding CopG/RHH family protein
MKKDRDQRKPIDQLEADWMEDIDEGKTVRNEEAEKRLLGKMVVDPSLKKSNPVSLRIPASDLEAIQIRAAKDGIPYQTLIKSILHKFATNQIDI